MNDLDSFTMVMSIPMPAKPQGPKLPYDPFTFNLFLVPISSEFPKDMEREYEILAGAARILGKVDRDITIAYPTISRDHCKFEANNIQDLGSTTGTYVWMTATHGHKIANGDLFVVGEKQHILQVIDLNKRKLQYSLNGIKHAVVAKEDELLIGSSLTCDIIDPTLKDIEGKISLDGTIKHFEVEDRVKFNSGIWLRLSEKGQQSKLYPIKEGDILRMGPIIFQLRY
jgi:hypothetical protein